MIHLCTYFDHAYLVRALALHDSLARYSSPFTLWALCFDDEALRIVRSLELPTFRPISIVELEDADPELAACRRDRSKYEYYWTCTPCLPRFLLATHAGIDSIAYVDADLWFFADARKAEAAAGDCAIAITPHRFPARFAAKMGANGRFNVGWMNFRREAAALACLDWWRERCIEWCYDRFEPSRFGDQKYLEAFPERFDRVGIVEDPGVNAGPWNIRNYQVSERDGQVMLDASPLVAYHFSRITRLGPGYYLDNSRVRTLLDRHGRRLIYRPYLRDLESVETRMRDGGHAVTALGGDSKTPTLRRKLRRLLDHSVGIPSAVLRGIVVRS